MHELIKLIIRKIVHRIKIKNISRKKKQCTFKESTRGKQLIK